MRNHRRRLPRLSLKRRINGFIVQRANSRREAQTLSVLMVMMSLLAVGMPLHFVGTVGNGALTPLVLSGAMWLTAIATIIVVAWDKNADAARLLATVSILISLIVSAKVVWFTNARPQSFLYNLLFNEMNGMVAVLVLVMGYIGRVPYVAAAINILTLCYSYYVLRFDGLLLFLALIAFVDIFICVLGSLLNSNYSAIESENAQYQDYEQKLLDATNLSHDALMEYIRMSLNAKPGPDEANDFFNLLSPVSQRNIIRAAEVREIDRVSTVAAILEIWPMLTNSEVDVCRYIARGMTQREIAQILDKTENNVGTVRIHIRHKLGLKPGDNLRKFITDSLYAYDEARKAKTETTPEATPATGASPEAKIVRGNTNGIF